MRNTRIFRILSILSWFWVFDALRFCCWRARWPLLGSRSACSPPSCLRTGWFSGNGPLLCGDAWVPRRGHFSSTLNGYNRELVRHGRGAIGCMSTSSQDSSQNRDRRPPSRVDAAASSRRISVTVSQRAWQYLVERSSAEGRSLSNLASFLLESAVPDQ